MGVTDRLAGLFAQPAVERGVYRCESCGTDGESGEGVCPECGGEMRLVDAPVRYVYPEPY